MRILRNRSSEIFGSNFGFSAGEILGGENGEISKLPGEEKSQALETGEIRIEEEIVFIEDMLINSLIFLRDI